jgi:glycosyltransferase domain-containing protein
MKSLTLIIPTHNRQNYLNRSYAYYSSFNIKVIYCDSTLNSSNLIQTDNITYLHLPNYTFSQKILYVLEKVDTEYIALCADDDFVLYNALLNGYNLITKNRNITAIIGNILEFHEKFDKTYFSNKLYEKTTFNFYPQKNVEKFLSNYRQILWGMYNKQILTTSFRIINDLKLSNDNFIELIIGAISSYNGEIEFINQIWLARELSSKEHWATRHESLFYYKTSKLIQNDIIKFQEAIDCQTEKGIGKIAISSYLKATLLTKLKYSLKGLIKNNIRFKFIKCKHQNNSNYKQLFDYTNNDDLNKISRILSKFVNV